MKIKNWNYLPSIEVCCLFSDKLRDSNPGVPNSIQWCTYSINLIKLNYFIDNSLQDATLPEALKNNVVEEVVEPNESVDKIVEGNIIYDIVIFLDACTFCNFKSFPDDSPTDDKELDSTL